MNDQLSSPNAPIQREDVEIVLKSTPQTSSSDLPTDPEARLAARETRIAYYNSFIAFGNVASLGAGIELLAIEEEGLQRFRRVKVDDKTSREMSMSEYLDYAANLTSDPKIKSCSSRSTLWRAKNFAKVNRTIRSRASHLMPPMVQGHATPLATLNQEDQVLAWARILEKYPNGSGLTQDKCEIEVATFRGSKGKAKKSSYQSLKAQMLDYIRQLKCAIYEGREKDSRLLVDETENWLNPKTPRDARKARSRRPKKPRRTTRAKSDNPKATQSKIRESNTSPVSQVPPSTPPAPASAPEPNSGRTVPIHSADRDQITRTGGDSLPSEGYPRLGSGWRIWFMDWMGSYSVFVKFDQRNDPRRECLKDRYEFDPAGLQWRPRVSFQRREEVAAEIERLARLLDVR